MSYHEQPHTLDPTKPEIPDGAPLAQGHTAEDAAGVSDAAAEHTEQVKAEADQPEVGARAPGDHAQAKAKPKKASEDK